MLAAGLAVAATVLLTSAGRSASAERGAVAAAPSRSETVTVTVDRRRAIGASLLALGVTHEQYSLDPWGDPAAVRRGKALLEAAFSYQNQHIYGWGATNPEPSPGVFDWRSLDRRINLIRSMRATPVITLCCAPDWMTGRGKNTSTYPNEPPTPAHYGDFAELARQVALRYPDVTYYQVWSEMKGLWSRDANNWNYVAYTNLYNAVYDALKGVNPAIRVGGPYVVIEGSGSGSLGRTGYPETADPITGRDQTTIAYWLTHKHGADFVSIDRTVIDDHDTNTYTRDQVFELTHWFGDIARKIKKLTKLPVWFAEDYEREDDSWKFQAAEYASMLRSELLGGTSVSLHWGPQGEAGSASGGNDRNLFSDTRESGGGQPFPTYVVYKIFHDYFGPGTRLYPASSSSPAVQVLAARTGTLLINTRPFRVSVRVNGSTVELGRYAVKMIAAV